MSRQETQIIKGIALLMMLWLHLFLNVEQTLACENIIYIGDLPLATLLTRACPPVGFFVFCGGYGLYYTYKRGKDKHYLSRIAKLFVAYWLIILACVPLCIYVISTSLKTDTLSIFYNITALQTKWDIPCWFLFPYALLSLSYPLLFPLYDKIRIRYFLPIVFLLSFSMMVLLHLYGVSYINDRPYLSIPVCYISFLFLFFCGASVLRCDVIHRIRKLISSKSKSICTIQILGIILIVILKIILNTSADVYFYTLAIVFLVLLKPFNPHGFISRFFEHIGKHSMNMWMIHYMLYVHLLHDVIYGMRYPILIFLCLLLLSYLSSILMNVILKPIYSVLRLN